MTEKRSVRQTYVRPTPRVPSQLVPRIAVSHHLFREVALLPKSRRLRRMLLAYSVNELGTWFGYVALAVGVFDSTGSALATAALFIARGLVPALLAPVLVARVERSPRPSALSLLYFAEAALTLGLAALLWQFSLAGVLVLVAVDGVVAVAATALLRATAAEIAGEEERGGDRTPQDAPARAAAQPPPDGWSQRTPAAERGTAETAMLPARARRGSTISTGEAAQRQANAALNMSFMVAFAVGPALGGVLVHAVGGPLALALDAATFALCGLLLRGLRSAVAGEEESIRARLAGTWRYIQEMPALRTLLLTEAVAIVFFASVEPVEVVYAKSTLSAGTIGLGILLAVWGTGAALGAVVFARAANRSLGSMLTAGTLLVGLGYLGFAAAPTLAIACIAALFGGIGNGVQWPALISAVQRVAPQRFQGRLMGAIGSMGALCPAIGFALGGVLAATTSTRIAMLVAGAVATLATLGFARLAVRGLPVAEEQETAAESEPALMS